MKIFKLLTAVLAVFLMFLAGYVGYLYYLNGKSFSVSGQVQFKKAAEGVWRPFEKKDRLSQGDIVKVGTDSNCEVIVGNTANFIVKLEENTEVKVLNKNPIKMELVKGELLAALTRPSKNQKFTVKTPNAVCGVRGTGWRVFSSGNTGTQIEVFEGRVKSGKDIGMYDNDPYIAHDNSSLSIDSNRGVDFVYKELNPDEYPVWNKWINSSRKKLGEMYVFNYLKDSRPKPYPVWQEGVTYGSWYSIGYESLESDLSMKKMEKDTNASWVNIITTWYQEDIHSTRIWRHPEKTPTDESLRYIFKKAERLGLHIMFSPFVDPVSLEEGAWRAEIGFTTNDQWDAWFASYTEYILYAAELAQENNVDILNIGTELSMSSTKRPDKWIELISKVRQVYDGKLVYTANWFEEYREIEFWKELDYAGLSAYFPLAGKEKPSYWEIKKGWSKWAKEIEAWQKTHLKPVLFTEIGYRSVVGSAQEPWDYSKGGEVDLAQQYNCYKAALETFWNKEWFYGYYWWVWRTQSSIQGQFHRGYTPNDKPVSGLLDAWYSKPDPHKYKSILKRIKKFF